MSEKKELAPELKERLKIEYSKDWRQELRKSLPMKERMKIERQKMPDLNRRTGCLKSGKRDTG